MAYLQLFNGATPISQGDETSPIVVGYINASTNEVSAPIQLTLKCDTGFKTLDTTTISFVGATNAKWSLCATIDGTYTPTLDIPTEINSTGTSFYVKAQATSDENPTNDVAVDVQIVASVAAI